MISKNNNQNHDNEDQGRIAKLLRSALENQELVDPVRTLASDPSETLAKSIQRENVDHWIADGRRMVGSKVGITSPVAQQQFGIKSPVYGTLFADMVCSDGATVSFDRVPQLRVEAEIAFVLKADIDNPDPTIAEIISAIDYGLPAIELVSPRIRDWDMTIFDFIADNAAGSMIVLGETPFDIRGCDVRTLGAVMTISGLQRSHGSGGAYLGSPLQSLRWLACERAADGNPLRAGEVVMTGSLGPIVPADQGVLIDIRIGHLPSVVVEIS